MDIRINSTSKIAEIQKSFNSQFPYLKLEFFNYEKGKEEIFCRKNQIADSSKTIGEYYRLIEEGTISIKGNQKVGSLEESFKKKFGISVQVFRKSANSWLQTSFTDDWTLSEQNKMGEELDSTIKEQASVDYDEYHEQI